MAGVGGVICNEEGTIFLYYLGPAGECSNNKAKILSLKIGLQEASRFGNQWLIIKGDSKCVILWASQAFTPTWFLVDIIQEVIQSYENLYVSFHHILRSANSEVGCLAKEGVLRPSLFISFDC